MNIIQTEQDFLSFIRDQAMSNGNLSIRGVARCCDVPHTSVIRDGAFASVKLAEAFAMNGFEACSLSAFGFPLKALEIALRYFAYESKVKRPNAEKNYCLLKGIPCENHAKLTRLRVSTRKEYEICQSFASEFTQFEVKTPMGDIDILTPQHIIEVKTVKSAHNALGQILCYSHYYPNHQKVILLFGSQSKFDVVKLKDFKTICKPLNVRVLSVNTAKNLENAKYQIIDKNLLRYKLQAS